MRADAPCSPWLVALGPNLPSRLIALLSTDGTDTATDTWCWQALYLLQPHLTLSQQEQLIQHPAVQRVRCLFCRATSLRSCGC